MISIVKRITYFLAAFTLLIACKKNSGPNPYDAVVETDLMVNKAVTAKVDKAVGGYYVALPALYDKTSKAYPLLMFLHGAGQYGSGSAADLPYLLQDGLAKVIDQKKFPASFHVNNKDYSFIVITPQFISYPSGGQVVEVINYMKKKYRIDNARVYVSGLSLGGFVATDVASNYPSTVAAIVPISGVATDSISCAHIAQGNVPVWSFHNIADPSISSETETIFINQINSHHPLRPPKLTLFPDAGHDAWTKALDPMYKEDNMNMYEWMLQYNR